MPLPTKMRAVGLKQPGGPGALFLQEVDLPGAAAGEVLIRVVGAGVNRPDVLQRQGLYPPPPGANERLGLEVSGVVVALGKGVAADWEGRLVMALCNGGGYAEYVAVPAVLCMAIPKGVSVLDAASLPETNLTVWQNVMLKGALQPGDHLLVHGGSSGIGCAAIQLAAAHGAIVHVTAGSAQKLEFCARLGAHYGYNYRTDDWSKRAKHNSEGGVQVILDMVAGNYLNKGLACLGQEGKLVIIALLGGRIAEIDAAKLLLKQAVLTGSTLRPRSVAFKAELASAVEARLAELFETGRYRTTIQARFALEDVAQAHELMESGQLRGKIVLSVNEL